MTVKTSKVLIFFLLKTLWHKYQIMNSNIYHHNNITTKSWILIFVMTILQLKTFKTQVTTNTRALIYLGLYGLVAKRISHTTFNIPCLLWKEFKSCEEQILHVASQLQTINKTCHYTSLVDCCDSNEWSGWDYVSKTLNNCLNKFLFMIILF